MKNNSESVENSCCVGPGVQRDTLALLQKEFAPNEDGKSVCGLDFILQWDGAAAVAGLEEVVQGRSKESLAVCDNGDIL